MNNKKPVVVFLSRAYQNKLFPRLTSELYDSVHVTMSLNEKKKLEDMGIKVDFCFENYDYRSVNIDSNYLISSFKSDRFLSNRKVKDRQLFLQKEVSFWQDVFCHYEPIAVINEIVAIEFAEVLYIEARKRDIRYLAWMANPVNGYFYWVSTPMNLSLDKKHFLLAPSERSLRIASEYVQKIIHKNERPYYLTRFLNQNKYSNLNKSIKGILKFWFKSPFMKVNKYENNKGALYNNFERALKSYFPKYDDIKVLEDYEVILYPLHIEPEASLSYISEFFSNQVATIENISKCLTVNQVLVVKEHPVQAGMLLTKKFQDLYRSTSNLFYLPASITSYEIINKASLIVTLTSHLGWEAMMFGKPVYLLGKMFYDKYPFVNKFTTYENLRAEIRERRYQYPDKESLITYIAQILDISFEAKPFPNINLYESQNLKNIVLAIEKELHLD